MFDHVTLRVAGMEASDRFYTLVLDTLEIRPNHRDDDFVEWEDFSLVTASADRPPTRNLHVGFVAPSREHVDAFWRAGTEAGYADDGAPGPRPEYRDDYYGAFLRDPDGNSAEAVWHGDLRRGGYVDHLWLRVADVATAARFYEVIAPHAGFEKKAHVPGHAQFAGESGSFSLVPGSATANVHMAFPSATDAAVDAFHAAALAAGYRDNGPPGERPVYHAGYYGAFVLDPDGNNVEVVNHNRRA
jgi:catechol 2,3-dioxygenase-like lactoylglutathione lyase family enzyme